MNTDKNMDTPIHVAQHGRVQVVTINRPEVRNAINTETAVAIATALRNSTPATTSSPA